MTFPEPPYRAFVRLWGVAPVEVRHPGGTIWWPARLTDWVCDAVGWHGFTLLEHLPGPVYREPKDAAHGWLDLVDIRPAGHDVSSAVLPLAGRGDDRVDSWFWPPDA